MIMSMVSLIIAIFLIIGAEKYTSILNYEDRGTCFIFGDGAGAVLLEPTTEDIGIIDSILRSDGSGRVHLHQKSFENGLRDHQ